MIIGNNVVTASKETLEKRISIISKKASLNKDIQMAKERLEEDKRSAALSELQGLAPRIQDLLIVVNKCIELGIKLPNDVESKKFGYGNGYNSYNFCADGICHRTGFMDALLLSKHSKIKYLGSYGGGFCGKYDFYTNGNKTFLQHEDDKTRKPAEYRYIKKFLGEFDTFENAFYKWIDSLNNTDEDAYLLNKICFGGTITRKDLRTPNINMKATNYLTEGTERISKNKNATLYHMTIGDVIDKIRNVGCIMIHSNDGTKSMEIEEIEEYERNFEFVWFEVTNFAGRPCIEFNL